MKNKKRSSVETIYFAGSYEFLGHTTNYDCERVTDLNVGEKFNEALYAELINNYEANSLTHLIHKRKSVRRFSDSSISINEISEILFNAYSLKDAEGSMTIPVAGGLSIMSLLVFLYENNSWIAYKYNHLNYHLEKLDNSIENLSKFFYTQSVDFNSAKACIIISSELCALSQVYLSRAFKFSAFQAGHVAQNILLTATALGLNGIPLGSLIESEIMTSFDMVDEYPLYAVVLGR
jgi:SagB-type dehydrogenase family enzyme